MAQKSSKRNKPVKLPPGIVVIVGSAAVGKTDIAVKLTKSAGKDGAVLISQEELTEAIKNRDAETSEWRATSEVMSVAGQTFSDALSAGKSIVFDLRIADTAALRGVLNLLAEKTNHTDISLVKVLGNYNEQLEKLQSHYKLSATGATRVANSSNCRFERILHECFSKTGHRLTSEIQYDPRDGHRLVFAKRQT